MERKKEPEMLSEDMKMDMLGEEVGAAGDGVHSEGQRALY